MQPIPDKGAARTRRVIPFAERGATLSEYALIMSLVTVTSIGALSLLQTAAGDYLQDTGSDIGTPRDLAIDIDPDLPDTPAWLSQPPPPTTSTTASTTTAPSYGANLLSNASFETPLVGPVGGTDWGVSASSGWSSTDPSGIELWQSGHNGVPSYAGDQHAELNLNAATTYWQTVFTNPGSTYRWSLAHRGRSDTDTLEVLIDNVVVDTISTGPGTWVVYEGTFVAAGGTVSLGFRSVDPGGLGNLMDDIVLQEQLP